MRIDTFEKLLAMLLLQAANLPTYKTQVGATDADIKTVAEDAAVLQYLADYLALVEANKKVVTKIKQIAYNGDTDEEISPFPVFPAAAPPFAIVAGCLERANKRNRRFKAADGYTKEIGIALGIDGDSARIEPDTIKATFEAFPAQMGYEAALVIANRGKSDMWKARGQKANGEKWFDLASGTGKSGNLKIALTEESKPERMLVMIQLYKNNEPYGQASDPQYVTFNP
jgi:hypothetical protein